MKTLFLRTCVLICTTLFSVFLAKADCTPSFTYAVSGLTVTFTNTSLNTNGTAAGLSYIWSFTGGATSTLKDPVITFTTGGFKSVYLSITDSSTGCFSGYSDTFTLVAPGSACAASFTKTISGTTVHFNSTSLNSLGTTAQLAYYWTFSDGISSSLKDPTIVFPTGGTKIASLTIVDSTSISGCSSSVSDSFTLVAPGGVCSASFTKTISGTTVHFNSTSLNSLGTTAQLAYYWTFSDGISSSLKDPTIVFPTGGTKIASLTIVDSTSISGCSSSVSDSFTLVAPGGVCSASFTKTISGTTVHFNSTSVNSIGTATGLAYYWTFSGGISSSLKDPTIVFPSGGPKIAILTIVDSTVVSGCISSVTDSFTLTSSGNNCNASFLFPLIAPLTVKLISTSTNTNGSSTGLTYFWSFSDGTSTITTQQTITKTFASPGVKWVSLTIRDSVQGCFSSKTDSFMLSASSCAASFSRTISDLTVSFTNTSLNTDGSSSGLHYLWNFGDGTTSDLKNPVKTYSTGGIKNVSLFISDSAQGCYSSTTDSFMVSPPAPLCEASFSLAIDTANPFSFYILNTSLVRPTSEYFWTFGDGDTSTSATPTHSYASFGIYQICLTITDPVCTSTFCDSVGMDSSGTLFKTGKFGFTVLDYTTMATTGLKNIDNSLSDLKAYPNPGSAIVNLDFSIVESSVVTFQVTDLTGKVVLSNSIQGKTGENAGTIDISGLDPSIYFLRISTPTTHKVLKLIKN